MTLNCGRADEMWGRVKNKKQKLGLARGGLTKMVAVLCDQTDRQAGLWAGRQRDE